MHAHVHVNSSACQTAKAGRRLGAALLLSLITAVVELVGARRSGSLALLADAGHVAFDSLAIALAWGALRLARRPASDGYSFGYARAEVLAAALNGMALLAVAAGLLIQGIERVLRPTPVAVGTMVTVAAVGLVCNGLSLWLLETCRDNVGVRAAFLHVAGDVLVALGVILGGALMHWTHAASIDGWLTVGIAVVLAVGALRLLSSVTRVLMEATPQRVQVHELRAALAAIDGVAEVRSLRLWSLTPSRHLLMAHIGRTPAGPAGPALGETLAQLAHERFGVEHATVQVHDAAKDTPAP